MDCELGAPGLTMRSDGNWGFLGVTSSVCFFSLNALNSAGASLPLASLARHLGSEDLPKRVMRRCKRRLGEKANLIVEHVIILARVQGARSSGQEEATSQLEHSSAATTTQRGCVQSQPIFQSFQRLHSPLNCSLHKHSSSAILPGSCFTTASCMSQLPQPSQLMQAWHLQWQQWPLGGHTFPGYGNFRVTHQL